MLQVLFGLLMRRKNSTGIGPPILLRKFSKVCYVPGAMKIGTIFGQPKPAPIAEPEETVEAGRARRERELLFALRGIDCELSEIADAAKAFRKNNCTVAGGRVVLIASNLTARPALEAQWQDLSGRTYRLQQKRNQILQEWSSLKESEGSHAH